MIHTSDERDPVEALAEEFLERRRRGEQLSVTEYARQHPDLAGRIGDVFPALLALEDLRSAQSPRDARLTASVTGPIPAALGDFRIIREVGRGGMGVVYEAEQVSLGRRVALKVLPQHLLTNEKHAKRFDREARAAARLHHTNIVPVFGVGEQDGVHYYVMQFIHGLGLDEVLVELKRLRDESIAAKSGQPATAREPVAAAPVAAGHGKVAVQVAESLLTGQFEKTVLVDGSEDGGQKPEVGGGSDGRGWTERSEGSPGERRSALEGGLRVAADTTLAQLADTAVSSGAFALPGQSAATSKVQSQQVYWQSVARIGVQAADALQYAHDQGIIHRDIKPGNLLLDARGTVWVTDFGLAKATDQQDLTHTGDLLGTLRYMAPEQFDGKADARSDVYALGLTLYELLALQPGFDETDRRKLIKQVTTGAPVRLRLVESRIPRDLETIVHKAIERDPAQRYKTAGELAADLQRYLGDEPIRARRISPVTRFTRWCKRNPVVAGLTSAIAILITTAAVVASIAAVRFEKLAEDNGKLARDLQSALGDAEKNLTLANAETNRAEAALAQVQSEQQRAEGNLDLALTALDAVYLDAIGTEKLMGNQRTRPQAVEAGFSPSANAPLTDLEKELLRRGLTFYDRFAQQNSATPRAAVQTAQAHFRVGLLQGALGDNAAAETAYRAAIERFEALTKAEPNNVEYHRRLAQAYSGLSRSISDWDTAKPYIERSIEVYTAAIRLSPNEAELYRARSVENGHIPRRGGEERADLIKAADLAPDNLELQLGVAALLYFTDSHEQCRRYAERAFALDPDSSAAAHAMACTFPGDGTEHLKYLTLAIKRDPKRVWARIARASAYNRRNEFGPAHEDAHVAVDQAPDNANALIELGRACAGLGRFAEAEDALERALSFNPHNWFALAVLGEFRLRQREYDKAVEALSHAIELCPGERWWLDPLRVQALVHLGRFREVLADQTTALKLRPSDTSPLFWLEPTAIARCRDEDVKQELIKLVDDIVANTGTHRERHYRITLNLTLGRYDQARRDWDAVAASGELDHFDFYQHALLNLQLQDEAAYKTSIRTMLERFAQSDDPQAANYAAWTCALVPQALDDYAPAVALAERAVATKPDDSQFLTTFGAVLSRAGRHAEALEQLSKLPANPQATTDADAPSSPAYAWYILAMTHHALGDADQARTLLAKADAWTDAAFADSSKPPVWNRTLTLRLLREEARALIGPAPADNASGVSTHDGPPAPPQSERKRGSDNDSVM